MLGFARPPYLDTYEQLGCYAVTKNAAPQNGQLPLGVG